MSTASGTLDGTYNFRDLGGLPLESGGVTRGGVLYRSDALGTLTTSGLEDLTATDIGVIVDFRTPVERRMTPDRVPQTRPFRVVELSILEGAVSGMAQQALQSGLPSGDPAAAAAAIGAAIGSLPTLSELYIDMLEHAAAAFAQVARLVAAPVDAPSAVLIHCTAGKDRTGVCAALLLDAVGVRRDAVVRDYTTSEENLSGAWAEGMYALIERLGAPLTPQITGLVAATPPGAISDALAWVDARGGSLAYLQEGGLTTDEASSLRARLRA